MPKNLFTKLCITLLISTMFSMIILTNNVKALCTEETISVLEEVSDEETIDTEENPYVEEKIMKYDAITDTTTEVDMEELKQLSTVLRSKNEDNSLTVESIQPSKEYMSKLVPKIPNYSLLSSDREIIGDTSILPYSAVCKIMFSESSSNDKQGIGSGTLVAKNAVLTSAHCVFDKNNNNAKFKDWVACPAFNGAPYLGLESGWSQVYYSSLWKENHSYEYDWAVCILEKSLGSTVGAVGATSYETSAEMKNLEVRTFRLS